MQIIGHRGAKALLPENSLPGFLLTLNKGVDWVEFDVRRTKDNQPVVFHDASLLRLAKDARRVDSLTLAELKAITLNSGAKIPTLSEVLDLIGDKAKIDIEIKDIGIADQVHQQILAQIATGRSMDDFLVTSFSLKILRKMHAIDSNVPLGLLQHVWPLAFLTAKLPLTAVGFSNKLAPKTAIALAKKRGIWSYVYTVNSKKRLQALQKRGVQAIVTDYATDLPK